MPLADAVNDAVDELKAAGLVAFLLGKTRKAAPKIALTAEGRQRGLEILGVAQLRPRTTWGVLRKTYLPASVLGLPASSEARSRRWRRTRSSRRCCSSGSTTCRSPRSPRSWTTPSTPWPGS